MEPRECRICGNTKEDDPMLTEAESYPAYRTGGLSAEAVIVTFQTRGGRIIITTKERWLKFIDEYVRYSHAIINDADGKGAL